MPRPRTCRRLSGQPPSRRFKPVGIPAITLEEVRLKPDEFEAIRLADGLGLYHQDAADRMGVSRQTFGRIIAAARGKVARALVEGLVLAIEEDGEETPASTPGQPPE